MAGEFDDLELVDEQAEGRFFINGTPEQRYWREVETGPRSGEWTSAGAGPPVSVVVTPKGIELYGRGMRLERPLRPGQARWLAIRILEGLGIYETTFAGDGSAPPGGGARPPLVVNGGVSAVGRPGPASGARPWVCGCGTTGTNAGGMSIHNKTCKQGPAKPVEGD